MSKDYKGKANSCNFRFVTKIVVYTNIVHTNIVYINMVYTNITLF